MICIEATTYNVEALRSITGVPVIPTEGRMTKLVAPGDGNGGVMG
jgi:hypothetical protein